MEVQRIERSSVVGLHHFFEVEVRCEVRVNWKLFVQAHFTFKKT
jgi:hypothetical protein